MTEPMSDEEDPLLRLFRTNQPLLDQHTNLSRELVIDPPRNSIQSAFRLAEYARAIIAAVAQKPEPRRDGWSR